MSAPLYDFPAYVAVLRTGDGKGEFVKVELASFSPAVALMRAERAGHRVARVIEVQIREVRPATLPTDLAVLRAEIAEARERAATEGGR